MCEHNRNVPFKAPSDDQTSVRIWGNNLVNFSGRGPTRECIIKPDIIAPGTNIVSCIPSLEHITDKRKKELEIVGGCYARMSGTSMSTPVVAGVAALMLEKHPDLTPNEIKCLLKRSAVSLDYPKNHQGWGALDINNFINQEVNHVSKKFE